METYITGITEKYTDNKLYKVMDGETLSYLCADSTAPINSVEITQEEWDMLEIELKERKENIQQEPDLYQQGYDQAVLDMIESGVL